MWLPYGEIGLPYFDKKRLAWPLRIFRNTQIGKIEGDQESFPIIC